MANAMDTSTSEPMIVQRTRETVTMSTMHNEGRPSLVVQANQLMYPSAETQAVSFGPITSRTKVALRAHAAQCEQAAVERKN